MADARMMGWLDRQRGWAAGLSPGSASGGLSLTYRPEIDGLRAVAVVAVILYHADPGLLPGGLIGVDVFFVISGYLISGQILQGLDRGTFSLAGFWMRRLRWIVPALLLMLFGTGVLACLFLPPAELPGFGSALLSSVLAVSNFYLRYRDGGYFAPDVRTNPLIHMWSLSVEEQFYLFYPAVLMLLLRYRPRWPSSAIPMPTPCPKD